MSHESKLNELFVDLPEPAPDAGNSRACVVVDKLLCVGGILPFSEGRIQHTGRVGVEIRPDNAKLAARMAAVYALAVARKELGSLDKVRRVVSTEGFVACGADFKDHAKVIDGACELFVHIFGNNGKGTRTAVGAFSLPQNACVELSVVFEIR